MNGTPRFDLTGKRFGHLVAIAYVGGKGAAWDCLCDCGTRKNVTGGNLRQGRARSCGCMTNSMKSKKLRLEDMSGQRFGRLVVRRFAGMRSHESYWECRCDCGGSAEVRGWMLRRGDTRSCGCLHREVAREDRTSSPTYSAIHSRLAATRGPARNHPCHDCGTNAAQWSYGHSDPRELLSELGHPYSDDLSHYQPRCMACHRAFDAIHGGR